MIVCSMKTIAAAIGTSTIWSTRLMCCFMRDVSGARSRRFHGDAGRFLPRIPAMTLLKLLATALVALSFMVIAVPGYAANDGDGAADGAPSNTQDPAAKPRRHHHHKHQRHGQRHPRRQQNPDQGTLDGSSGQG